MRITRKDLDGVLMFAAATCVLVALHIGVSTAMVIAHAAKALDR